MKDNGDISIILHEVLTIQEYEEEFSLGSSSPS